MSGYDPNACVYTPDEADLVRDLKTLIKGGNNEAEELLKKFQAEEVTFQVAQSSLNRMTQS